MNSVIKARFDDSCRVDVFDRYGLESHYKLLSDWHAFTFETHSRDNSYILRVSDDTHRTQADIEAELEWVAFARNGGVTAPAVIPSIHGRCTEVVDAGASRFTAVLFEKLSGKPVADADWNSNLFKRWGELVGRLHRLSVQFRPSKRRPQWQQSDFLNINSYIPDDLSEIKRIGHELLMEIGSLPRDPLSFGVIHADVYHDNFFISDGELQLFDFDNCEYGYFVSDLAICLYAALWRLRFGDDRQAFAIKFWKHFWMGYCKEFQLNRAQLVYLSLFLRLRELLIYIVARKKLDLANLTPVQARLLQERGDRIATRTPVVNVDGLFG